jgi:hypothetical protein
MARRNYAFDINMMLDDGTGAHGAAGYGQVGGSQGIVDLGGNQAITITLPSISNVSTITPQQARGDFACVIFINAITLAGSDIYNLTLVGSNSSSFASGNVNLGSMAFGQAAAFAYPNASVTATPPGAGNFPSGYQYEILFTNEVQNTPYEYVSLYFSGTFGSVTAKAYVAVLPRE